MNPSFFYNKFECFFSCPMETGEAHVDARIWKIALSRPFFQEKSLSSYSNKSIITTIPYLFFPGNPLAVIFTIISIVINSLNSQIFSIGRPHVFVKFFERIPRTLNAASSIISEALNFWISRSTQNTNVNFVDSSASLSVPIVHFLKYNNSLIYV